MSGPPIGSIPSAAAAAQRLLTGAAGLGIDPLDLDDLIHDLASNLASEINNGGLSAQILYLLDHLGEAETEEVLRAARR